MCGDSFASVYMRTPTGRVTVMAAGVLHISVPRFPMTRDYELHLLLSVHACSGVDGRKSNQTLDSKNNNHKILVSRRETNTQQESKY